MASVALADQGDCLWALGQLEAAAVVYKENIERAAKLEDIRQVAVGKGQLSTLRKNQKRYADALSGYQEALALFEQLDEPEAMATVWHQMGMVHKRLEDFVQAEQAYRQSLAINSQQGNEAGEASSLNELGNLYNAWQCPEQAVNFYRQAADLFVALGDLRHEGVTRNNAANTLIKLQCYDDARAELLRVIECKQTFGHVAEPWETWVSLSNLEQACDNLRAASEARQKALEAYLAYRRDGGENYESTGRLCIEVGREIQEGDTAVIEQDIEQLLNTDDWPKDFLCKLQAIISGERDMAIAEGKDLHYRDAAELILLLEQLQTGG